MSEVKKQKFDLGEFTQSVVEGFDQPTQVVEEEYDEEDGILEKRGGSCLPFQQVMPSNECQ